mgnify:FL=1
MVKCVKCADWARLYRKLSDDYILTKAMVERQRLELAKYEDKMDRYVSMVDREV